MIDIAPYIRSSVKSDSERLTRITNTLEELAQSNLGVEQVSRQALQLEKAKLTYSELSPEFLSLHTGKDIDVKDKRAFSFFRPNLHGILHVPRFSVYSLDNPKMHIHLFSNSYSYPSASFSVNEPKNIPTFILKQLAQSTGIFSPKDVANARSYENQLSFRSDRMSIRMQNRHGKEFSYKGSFDITLTSTFQKGLLPSTTRTSIQEARKVMNYIYLVAETKPEEWNARVTIREPQDPLLVGVIGDKLFLVDKFDTTSLEEYVSKEFTH